jgi:SAM-dependent methyltransferase
MDVEQLRLHASMEDRHWWFTGRRRILHSLVSALEPPSPDALVVDLGCGTGGNAAAFARAYRVIGVDPSRDAIALARDRFPNLEFHVGPIEREAELIKEADIVLLNDVLEHVPDDRRVLHALLEAMQPGGRLVLTVPAQPDLWAQHDVTLGHVRRYTLESLARVWEGANAVIQFTSYLNSRLYPIARLFRLASRRAGRALGTTGTDLWLPPSPVNRLLASIFAGESRRLLRALRGHGHPYRTGLSILAVLQRADRDTGESRVG